MALLLTLLLALAHSGSVRAYPFYWTDPVTNGFSRAQPGCTEHPQRAYGLHMPPFNDTGIAFTVRPNTTGTPAATTTVCPGRAYQVQVTWRGVRHFLITAPFNATFRSALSANQDFSKYYYSPSKPQCTNRLVAVNPAVTLSDSFTVPCNASGTFILNITTASSERSAYLTGSVVLKVNRTCAATTCPKLASPPPPKRSPPPKARSPPPKARSPPPKPKSPPPKSKSPPPKPKSPPPKPKSPPPKASLKSPPPKPKSPPPRKSPPPSPPRRSPPPKR